MATPDLELKWYTDEAQEVFVDLLSEPMAIPVAPDADSQRIYFGDQTVDLGIKGALPRKYKGVDWLSDSAKRDLAETRGQTPIESAIETFLNIGSGFLLSWALWLFVAAPLWGIETNLTESASLTGLFTIVSVIRSYAWRRAFNQGRITTWLRSLRA